jgi:tripartite-type tricarboxylate transporter receptor subunit TctC
MGRTSQRVMRNMALAITTTVVIGSIEVRSETWPNHPIRLIVPFAPGGSADIAARLVSDALYKGLSQPVVLEYKPGAGTTVASSYVAKARPDGYTLLLGTSSLTINPSLYHNLDYDPVRDFVAVANVAVMPLVAVVNSSTPARDPQQFIAYAKTLTRPVNCGSSGAGSMSHLACMLLQKQTGINVLHVPYRGSAPALLDLIAGRIDIVFDSASGTLQHIAAGTLRPIATTGPERQEVLKDVPTMIEAGLANFDCVWWTGIVGPRGIPDAAIEKIHSQVIRILATPEIAERFRGLGITPAEETRDAFTSRIRGDSTKWARVVKEAGATLD